MVFDESRAKEVENKFRAIYDLTQQNKDNNGAKNDLFKVLSETLKIEKNVVKEAFNQWASDEKKKIKEEGTELLDAIQANTKKKEE